MASLVSIFSPASHSVTIFVSSKLDVLKFRGTAGDWVGVNGIWYRRLDANVFNWIRSHLTKAIASGKLGDSEDKAVETVETIRKLGIRHGAFTEEAVRIERSISGFSWRDGFPAWVDRFYPESTNELA